MLIWIQGAGTTSQGNCSFLAVPGGNLPYRHVSCSFDWTNFQGISGWFPLFVCDTYPIIVFISHFFPWTACLLLSMVYLLSIACCNTRVFISAAPKPRQCWIKALHPKESGQIAARVESSLPWLKIQTTPCLSSRQFPALSLSQTHFHFRFFLFNFPQSEYQSSLCFILFCCFCSFKWEMPQIQWTA